MSIEEKLDQQELLAFARAAWFSVIPEGSYADRALNLYCREHGVAIAAERWLEIPPGAEAEAAA